MTLNSDFVEVLSAQQWIALYAATNWWKENVYFQRVNIGIIEESNVLPRLEHGQWQGSKQTLASLLQESLSRSILFFGDF